jgi:hypothetical protein
MNMDLHALLISTPIDRVARRVTSQAGAATVDTPLTKPELVALLQRLGRKQRLLKRVLKITNKRQHMNTVYKANKGIPNFRCATEPRAVTEYVRCGREMQRLNGELADLRRLRRFVADAEWECKKLMEQRAG